MRTLDFDSFAKQPKHIRFQGLVQAVGLEEDAMAQILGITRISIRSIKATGIPRGKDHQSQLHQVDRLVYLIRFVLYLTRYDVSKAKRFWRAENYFWGYDPKPPWYEKGIHQYLLDEGPEGLVKASQWVLSTRDKHGF